MTGRLPWSLRRHPHWIHWRQDKNGQKIPLRPTKNGGRISPTDLGAAVLYDEARSALSERDTGFQDQAIMGTAGLGILLSQEEGLVGVDMDSTREWRKDAKRVLELFGNRAWREKSPSGNGLHLLMRGVLPEGCRTRSQDFFAGRMEVYQRDRFLTVTGEGNGQMVGDASKALGKLVRGDLGLGSLIGQSETSPAEIQRVKSDLPDEDVLFEMAGMADQGLPGAETFMRIHREGVDGESDRSSSVHSAVSSLATVTKCPDQIRRILDTGEIGNTWLAGGRKKLDRWLNQELNRIIGRRMETEAVREQEENGLDEDEAGDDEPTERAQVRNDALQRYVLIKPQSRIWDAWTGTEYSVDTLNTAWLHVCRGGRGDPELANWLVRQQELTRVDGQTWIPCLWDAKRCMTLEDRIQPHDGKRLLNTWRGFPLTPIEGCVQAWLDLLEHLFSDPEERQCVLERIAFDVQKPDHKCNWHIVVIGVPDAGKDSLLAPMGRIYGRAFSTIGNEAVKSSYDDGLAKRKIVQVNEVRGLSGEALEKIKRQCATHAGGWEILNIKSEPQIEHPNIWSFYFLTNHEDAMRVERNERRFFVVKAENVMPEDLRERYYHWLDKEDGSQKLLWHLMHNVDLSDFEPAKVPFKTEAFWRMTEDSKSPSEHDLDEITDKGWHGFSEGLVDIKRVADAIKRNGQFCRVIDVKKHIQLMGWRRLDNIETGRKMVNNKRQRISRYLYAPEDSSLHGLEGPKLYDAVQKTQMGSEGFLDEED